jgi:hypothetical protein
MTIVSEPRFGPFFATTRNARLTSDPDRMSCQDSPPTSDYSQTPSNISPSQPLLENRGGQVDPNMTSPSFPWKQLFILCIIRFSDPISFNLIFPFINEVVV